MTDLSQTNEVECESTVVLVEGDRETIVGSAFISLSDGELEVTMVVDHDIFMGRGFQIKFEETYDLVKGRQFKFIAKKPRDLFLATNCEYCRKGE